MSETTSFWLSIFFNGGFAAFFLNRLLFQDYEEFERPKLFRFLDGIAFSLNLAAFLHTIL